jgi:hypothetical protein
MRTLRDKCEGVFDGGPQPSLEEVKAATEILERRRNKQHQRAERQQGEENCRCRSIRLCL